MPLSDAEARVQDALFSYVIQQRTSLEEAAEYLRLVMDAELLDKAIASLKRRQEAHVTRSRAVKDGKSYYDQAWYLGPKTNGCWTHYLGQLGETFGLEQLDKETTDITALLANPLVPGSKRKGLVMGNVQSGKTRNFAGVIAKAVDAGYRFIVVLSGIHNNLRTQTQGRLDGQLFNSAGWYPLTTPLSDFDAPLKPAELFRHQMAIYAVVKKNSNRLGKLNEMLKRDVGPDVLRKWPVLIVDDEADQATPNSLAQKQEISAINGHMQELWQTVQTGTYLAYTATPFANVLINPEGENDLFPSDFITSILPGTGYFGAERVFGLAETVDDEGNGTDGLDMVRQIPRADAESLKPSSDAVDRESDTVALPKSLREAVDWFVVATAIRRARGQLGDSSMLVHTTHYSAPHFKMRDALMEYVDSAGAALRSGDDSRFVASWERERFRAAEVASLPLPDLADVRRQIEPVLRSIEGIVDNGESEDRLSYEENQARTVIAGGGGTLSRGLTLEGLVVSYFTRTTNTYDTLLQMGRWFGYRPGYEDLPRVWVTEGLDKDYAFLARVEHDLRSEIVRVSESEYSPEQLGVRIRCHPGRLMVTAQNKMYAAQTVQLGLSGLMNQTFLLDGSASAQARNLAAVEALLADHALDPLSQVGARRFLARDIAGCRVRAFLNSFVVHDDQAWLAPSERQHITDWIERFADGDQWNVLLTSSRSGREELGQIKIAGTEIICLDRAPMNDSFNLRVNMKAVVSRSDLVADLVLPDGAAIDSDFAVMRRRFAQGRGLIIIYPLSGEAKAKSKAPDKHQERMDMPVDHPLLAFGIVYPSVDDERGDQGTFISVRRHWEVPVSVEGDDEEQGTDE